MFELRTAILSDYLAIAALHTESWRKTYRGILSNKFLEETVEKELLKKWYKRLSLPPTNQVVTLAIQNDTIIGFSCIYLNENEMYGTLLDNLHVAMNSQKLGVGKSLIIKCAKEILKKTNNPKMYLWVFDENINAKNVYERLGAINIETVRKENEDGTEANVCRYAWNDISFLAN